MKPLNTSFTILAIIMSIGVITAIFVAFTSITHNVILDENPKQVSVGDIFTVTNINENVITIKYMTHTCNWKDCKLVGKPMKISTFKSTQNHEAMSTGYLIELVHFMNPDLTYKQCEEYVISGVE